MCHIALAIRLVVFGGAGGNRTRCKLAQNASPPAQMQNIKTRNNLKQPAHSPNCVDVVNMRYACGTPATRRRPPFGCEWITYENGSRNVFANPERRGSDGVLLLAVMCREADLSVRLPTMPATDNWAAHGPSRRQPEAKGRLQDRERAVVVRGTYSSGDPSGQCDLCGNPGSRRCSHRRDATKYAAELQAKVGRETVALQAQESRAATHYAAELQAAQRRRDVEISQLREAQAALSDAATAVQSYVFYVDKKVRLQTTISDDDWIKSRPYVEPAVVGAQRLRALAQTLPTDTLRDAYVDVERLIFAVVKGSDDANAPDVWNEATKNQPDPIVRAVNATAKELRRLLQTYPG
jgi:hypothetical protein